MVDEEVDISEDVYRTSEEDFYLILKEYWDKLGVTSNSNIGNTDD